MNSARRTLYPAAAPAWMVGGPRRRILDLGSGVGSFAQLLVDEGHEVFCIDRDVEVVAATTERLGTRLHVAGQVE
jgi:predicted RNA methylase